MSTEAFYDLSASVAGLIRERMNAPSATELRLAPLTPRVEPVIEHRAPVLNGIADRSDLTNESNVTIGDYSYKAEHKYYGELYVPVYTLYNSKEPESSKRVLRFQRWQYPACCGLSILSNFSLWADIEQSELTKMLTEFFERTKQVWQPVIEFVGVNEAEYDEVFNEEYDEYDSEFKGYRSDYNYNVFIRSLIDSFDAIAIKEFRNPNSENKCTVFHMTNPSRTDEAINIQQEF